MRAFGEVYAALPLGRSWSVVRVRPGGGYVTIGELPLQAEAVVRWDEDGRLWALDRGARVLAPGHAQLKAAVPRTSVAWADESLHKVGGASGYLWRMKTRDVVLYEADRSRG